jgi:hypothetical protein
VGFSCLFDKRDNCFQASQRGIIKHLQLKGCKVNHKTIEKLFKDMSLLGITKPVLDVANVKCVMINPAFLSIKDFNNYYYMLAQFHLGSSGKAWAYVKVCIAIGRLVHPNTGEVLRRYENKRMHLWRLGDDKRYTKSKDSTKTIESIVIVYEGIEIIPTNERLTPRLLAIMGIKSSHE